PCFLFSSFSTFVPIHCSTISGSAKALKSNSNGKSNSLVITNSCLPSSALIFVFCSMLFLFFSALAMGIVVFHYGFQFIKPGIPHLAEWFNKICYFFHFFGI